MSSLTWTPAALSSDFQPWAGQGWRLVEAQHRVSTLRLVDTLAEQQILESLLEGAKPPVPEDCHGLDYLLSTPFRYDAPYPVGSRFRRAGRTPGVFYAAQQVETAVAELAFHRLLFHSDSPDTPLPSVAAEYTAFAVELVAVRALDLTRPPLDRDEARWTDQIDYASCQDLADVARAADACMIRYRSIRDPGRGMNMAVFACRAFAVSAPVARQSWRMLLRPGGAQALCEFPSAALEFSSASFADPRLAS